VEAGRGLCGLTIGPGHRFRSVDGLLTNFHLPRTSLLLLVAAFAGPATARAAYGAALRHEYRFYSYGDAMLVMGPRRAGGGGEE
jgi:S-adenosylmethionine:tRNA ribosyltransferase-isomerase